MQIPPEQFHVLPPNNDQSSHNYSSFWNKFKDSSLLLIWYIFLFGLSHYIMNFCHFSGIFLSVQGYYQAQFIKFLSYHTEPLTVILSKLINIEITINFFLRGDHVIHHTVLVIFLLAKHLMEILLRIYSMLIQFPIVY